MAAADALFIPEGDRFQPTDLARGPWDPGALHGGPATGLLAAVIEDHEADPAAPTALTRITVELLRPVPVEPLAVRVRTVRPGRKVQLVEASLLAGPEGAEREVCRAVALRVRVADMALPSDADPYAEPAPGPVPPASSTGHPLAREQEWAAFHNEGVEMRMLRGGFGQSGPATIWIRLLVPVVAGRETSPVVRTASLSDFGNGISSVLPFERYTFVNPDLTVTLARPMAGEWLCLDARTVLGPAGAAMAESALFDEHGRIGRAVQSIFVDTR